MLSPLKATTPRLLPRLQSAPKPVTEKLDGAPLLDRAATEAKPKTLVPAPSAPRTWQMPRIHFEDWTRGGRNRRRMREACEAFAGRDFSRALQKVAHVVEETKSYESRLLLALVQISMGKATDADALLQNLLCERRYDEATHMARAFLAFCRRDADKAWISLTQVTAHYPGNSVAWIFRSLANGALNYENLAAMDVAHLRRTLPTKVLEPVVSATNNLRRNVVERAFADLDPIYRQPTHPEVVDVLWAHTCELLGFRDDALATYDALLARDPMNVAAAVLRAGVLQRTTGD